MCRLRALLFHRYLVVAGLLLGHSWLFSACRTSEDVAADGSRPDATEGFAFPEPRRDLVPSVGTEATLEMATWNIENYPKVVGAPSDLADLIVSLDLDLVAFQEIEDTEAFNELVERLRGYEGLLSSHTYGDGTYQKVGYVYRSDLISISGAFLLFSAQGYEFPRPPLKVDVNVNNGARSLDFTALALHLKAGEGFSNQQRREDAVVLLEDYLRTTVDAGNGRLALLGDFNDTLVGDGASVFAPLSSAEELYTIRTQGNSDAGEFTFLHSDVMLDHIVTTAGFDAEFSDGATIIPRLDMQMTDYIGRVSDHFPVIVRVNL